MPINNKPMSEANQRPIRCPNGPNRFVPIRYEMEAGKNAAPSCHFSASILSIMKIGKDGSNMAIPMLANVIAPAAIRMYGSLTKATKLGASSSLFVTFG